MVKLTSFLSNHSTGVSHVVYLQSPSAINYFITYFVSTLSYHRRHPMDGNDVGSACRLLVRQAGWSVREDSPEQWDQEEVNVIRDGFLQGVIYPVVGAG